MAACSRKRPGGPVSSAATIRPSASAIALAVPRRAVLLGEADHAPCRIGARRAPRLVDEQEREQARRLALGGQQETQHPREVERAPGQLVADEHVAGGRGVPGRVEQVDRR